MYGNISFRHSADELLNGLPIDIRIVTPLERFKSKVKYLKIGHF